MTFDKLTTVSIVALSLSAGAAVLPPAAAACTRALYTGSDDMVITGRSMDWMQDMQTDLWAFPRGMARNGAAGPDSPKWVSKYGSVIASGYDANKTFIENGRFHGELIARRLRDSAGEGANPSPS